MSDMLNTLKNLLENDELKNSLKSVINNMPDFSGNDDGINNAQDSTPDQDKKQDSDDSLFGNLDFSKIMSLAPLLSSATTDDNNIALLRALRPLLTDKEKKIDTAIKFMRIIKLYPIIKDSGIINDLFK